MARVISSKSTRLGRRPEELVSAPACRVATLRAPAEARLARYPQSGSGTCSLYEVETTLEQVFVDLRLADMAPDEKEGIRLELGVIHCRGSNEFAASPKLNPNNRLQVNDIVATLEAISSHLRAVDPPLRGCEFGIRDIHDIEVAKKVTEFLAMNPEIGPEIADEFLSDFCDRLNTVSHACFVAATDLKSIKGKGGRRELAWFDDFTRLLMSIAERNGISTTKVQGRFLDLASGFEQLFHPTMGMRSPSRAALAKRLSRAVKDFRQR